MVAIKSRNDFIAGSENEYMKRAVNYRNKLHTYKDILGLSDEVVAKETAMIDSLAARQQKKNELLKKASSEVEEFQVSKNEMTQYMRVRRLEIQASENYTRAIGIDMGLEATYAVTDTDNLTPDIQVTLDGGFPRIKFHKKGTEGIRIYSRINGQGQFNFLNTCSKRSYLDGRPKGNPLEPELREYYAYYILNDHQVGKQSQVLQISL